MKNLIYAAAFTLVLASWVPFAHATGDRRDFKVPHIIHSGVHSSGTRGLDATHHLEIDVRGTALSELTIDIPEEVSIRRGIKVTNQSGQRVEATVSITNRKATINFSQPVPPETILSIEMQSVYTPRYRHFWLYRIYGKMVDLNAEIPLGTAQFQTPGR